MARLDTLMGMLPQENPRPTCPECGKTVHPELAFPFGDAKTVQERVLEGIYDSADCILDAIKRGYPKDRARRV